MLGFQNRALNLKLLKFHALETIEVTSKNTIFNESSFTKFETSIGYVTSKWDQEWSRILILSIGYPYTQKDAKILTVNSQIISKNMTFCKWIQT